MNKGYILLLLLDDDTASSTSRRLASARPALAPKCNLYSFTGPYWRSMYSRETIGSQLEFALLIPDRFRKIS